MPSTRSSIGQRSVSSPRSGQARSATYAWRDAGGNAAGPASRYGSRDDPRPFRPSWSALPFRGPRRDPTLLNRANPKGSRSVKGVVPRGLEPVT